jgi:hypothetical protein
MNSLHDDNKYASVHTVHLKATYGNLRRLLMDVTHKEH